jgi:glucokinase
MFSDGKAIIGLDIGGTKSAVVVGTETAEIIWKKTMATKPERGFAEVFAELCGLINEAVAFKYPAAISVSVGGPLDPLRGLILSPPNLPGWDEIPLEEMLGRRYRLPVHIERDANAGALAELHFGAGKGCRDLIFLTMGTGLGAGLICNGRLYRGASFAAGEIGHLRIAESGPLGYGKAGSLEGYASGHGLAKLALSMFPGVWDESVAVPELYQAWKQGDSRAADVFQRAALHFGRGLAVLVDIFNPERIILGGLGMRIADALVEPALEILKIEALPASVSACKIVPAGLGESIGDVAALCAALEQGGFLPSR